MGDWGRFLAGRTEPSAAAPADADAAQPGAGEEAADGTPAQLAPSEPLPALADAAHVRMAYVVVGASAIIAAVVGALRDLDLTVPVEGFASLAVFYIAAQAIERALEPLASSERCEGRRVELAKIALAKAKAGTDKTAILAAQFKLDRVQANRRVWMWMYASLAGLLIAALLDLGLISAVVEEGGEDLGWLFEAADVAVTGLAIGAGTQPLHALIERLESSKKKADPQTGG